MNFEVGQALFLNIERFGDGGECSYKRPFLIIDVDMQNNQLKMLNVSSSVGKEHKVLFKSNVPLKNYNPPFVKDSFVKLDRLYVVDTPCDVKPMSKGQRLNQCDLDNVLQKFIAYNEDNEVTETFCKIS